ncbi:MAG: hercynine metabolism protein [Synechococcaceae cyanobacterium]|nr:hercynine metabolism protein [Synechococcaceae cyanobacterium]
MSNGASWLDDLEHRLENTLEAFLQANPSQEALLQEQEARDRQQSLRRQRLELLGQAELGRRRLLELAEEIRRWQARVQRAQEAGAEDLAGRAELHVGSLMEQGRQRWQELGELGSRFAAVEQELVELARQAPPAASPPAGVPAAASPAQSLETDWAAFEAQQELQELKQRMGR